jgi:hypothetical protein
VSIPDFRSFKAVINNFDFCTRNAAPSGGTKKMVEVKSFEGIMGSDPVASGFLAD